MKLFKILLVLSISTFFLAACGGKDKKSFETEFGSVITPPPVTPPTTPIQTELGVTNGSPFFFKLEKKMSGAKDYEIQQVCQFAPGSNSSSITCNINIPEALLYYSDFKFKMGTQNHEVCPIIEFTPYMYQRYNDKVTDMKGGEIDCSLPTPTKPDSSYCYGGLGPVLAKKYSLDFPTVSSFVFLFEESAFGSLEVESENTSLQYGHNNVNYLLANVGYNPVTAPLDPSNVKAGIIGTYSGYRINCRDGYGTLRHQININIDQIDGPTHEYIRW